MDIMDRLVLAGLIGLLLIQGCANFTLLRDAREVQLASAKAQMATGRLDKEMAETVMRIDANTRKGN